MQALDPALDAVEWDEATQACVAISPARGDGGSGGSSIKQAAARRRAVFWAYSGKPMRARRCCSFYGMVAAQWHELDRAQA